MRLQKFSFSFENISFFREKKSQAYHLKPQKKQTVHSQKIASYYWKIITLQIESVLLEEKNKGVSKILWITIHNSIVHINWYVMRGKQISESL